MEHQCKICGSGMKLVKYGGDHICGECLNLIKTCNFVQIACPVAIKQGLR